MFEKVNKYHPDKVADRIAGAIVDIAYTKEESPKIACEVLIGHGNASVIVETSANITEGEVKSVLRRIAGDFSAYNIVIVPQDRRLAENQRNGVKCGDNGVFRGCPTTREQLFLSEFVREREQAYPYDGKFIIYFDKLIVCQSHLQERDYATYMLNYKRMQAVINPLGEWIGGIDVDAGATNRKLGSDIGDAVTGGGLHGKDLSKADVSINVVCYLLAEKYKQKVEAYCAIGDDNILFQFDDGTEIDMDYDKVVLMAKDYIIYELGGFEKFAEYGLI